MTHARDVIAYIMAGATAVHLLTATVLDGLGLCKRINREVGSWLTRHGYSAVSDVRGSVASHWSRAEIDELENVDVVVDESLCDGCGLCLRYCQEAVEGAISIVGGKAKIDPVLCHRCTMCALVCPVDKAAITVTGWNG